MDVGLKGSMLLKENAWWVAVSPVYMMMLKTHVPMAPLKDLHTY